jgi:hypothetical protein
MRALPRLSLFFLVLSLALNGLWVICRDLPAEPEQQASVQSQASADEQQAECEKLCARHASLCLSSPGDKTSITIVAFGVAIFPPEIHVALPSASRQSATVVRDTHSDPSIAHLSPPPRA